MIAKSERGRGVTCATQGCKCVESVNFENE